MFGGPLIKVGNLHHIRDVDGAFPFYNRPLGILLALAHVLFDHARAFHDHALLFWSHTDDPPTFAFVGAGDQNHLVAFLNMKSWHKNNQMTSGASDTIFINFFSRNSRATGPKIRVPRGFNSLSMITMALLSKRR